MSQHVEVMPGQAAAVAALRSGEACGEGAPLRRIDTHMSHVFLSATRVYKLKRAVAHPFADMSSLQARRAACEAELSVNQALAPGLYLGVEPLVRRPDGAIRVGGEGTALDWLVVLRRFPDGALFSQMAEAGTLTSDLIDEAARAVAAFHARQPPHPEAGHAADYIRIIDGLRTTEAEAAARLGLASASEPLFAGLEHEVIRLGPLIEARRKAGRVRRGHGDLHLRNICLFEGRATPFDALEFDPALATADVLYDIAFLLLDLHACGLDDLAERARRTYWAAAGEPEAALALLPLFTALRAGVRAAVAVEAEDLETAARYRDLGLAILRTPAALSQGATARSAPPA
ncbi:hypothetical protein [Phenylobacterium sp.]|uniref:hypothetical protein n=1 Tax=Phenylobacterium sp. TaxID=1871053 RepID=UPI0035B177F7